MEVTTKEREGDRPPSPMIGREREMAPYKGHERSGLEARGLARVEGIVSKDVLDEVRILCKEEGWWLHDALNKGLELWIQHEKRRVYERGLTEIQSDKQPLGFRDYSKPLE